MKAYTKFVLFMFVLSMFGLPMIMKGPDGEPIMTWRDWLPSGESVDKSLAKLQSVTDVVTDAIDDTGVAEGAFNETEEFSNQAAAGSMYKWQDEKGQWHFSNQKPQSASQLSVEALPEVENLMQAPVVKSQSSSNIGAASNKAPAKSGMTIPGLSISKDQAGQMMQQLEQITKDAEQRKALMDQEL